ncbi:hypothetical protein F5Y15DRAFT_385449 [Xylariaceae sp. FL0016]|nr:hypothetical protein F5Y15DRAFT_385449 [Xylariaceae sp. FL0016]
MTGIDPLTRSAAAALFFSFLARWLISNDSGRHPELELLSEAVCWVMLPLGGLAKVKRFPSSPTKGDSPFLTPEKPSTSTFASWVVASGLATMAFFRVMPTMVELIPAVTPLLLIAQRTLEGDMRTVRTSDSWLFGPLAGTVWGSTLFAAFAAIALSDWDWPGLAVSTIQVVALLAVYVVFVLQSEGEHGSLPSVHSIEGLSSLSRKVLVLLASAMTLDLIVFGFPKTNFFYVLAVGTCKALSWHHMILISQKSSWLIATAVNTFAIATTRNVFAHYSDVRLLSQMSASLLSLGQTIHILPREAKSKSCLWVFSLLTLLLVFIQFYFEQGALSLATTHFHDHPVERLAQNAKTKFENLLLNQSSTYAAAEAEYKYRYGVDPPPGFEDWYYFAKASDSPIIDDFDTIYHGISPLWKLSGQEAHDMISRVQEESNRELWHCVFSGYSEKTRCHHPRRSFDRNIASSLDRLLRGSTGLANNFRDIKLLINHLDEPQVLLPPTNHRRDGILNFADLSRRPAWDTITRPCENRSIAQNRPAVEHSGIPFVSNPALSMDLCTHPEYSTMHGFALSPTSFRLVEGMVPVLSAGAPSTMGDILYPSPSYLDAAFQYNEAHDVDWDRKQNRLYWAGSNTGGYAHDDSWHQYQRQRFVALVQNLETQQHYYLDESEDLRSKVESKRLFTRLYDVAFTRIFQCETRQCRDQRAYFKRKSWVDGDEAFNSRLAFDIDGNGISGRYYKLLASRTTPLKQTIFREWHDDRLVPWVHYVPVSMGMEELPELVMYLTSTIEGEAVAKNIAEQGRELFHKALREVDMTIYIYRLLLELARLQDPERPSWNVSEERRGGHDYLANGRRSE